jgi:hypothetical protein
LDVGKVTFDLRDLSLSFKAITFFIAAEIAAMRLAVGKPLPASEPAPTQAFSARQLDSAAASTR